MFRLKSQGTLNSEKKEGLIEQLALKSCLKMQLESKVVYKKNAKRDTFTIGYTNRDKD